ncbi:MAG TPA: hypothetical protein VKB65_13530 [Myxococcota bacterium]|nr:hypothetical protein [Myxococcota bacterium]
MSNEDEDERDRRRQERRERRRKERILHTRISEELEDDLRRAAEELRVPVSNLVRNVLEEAVTVVEAVSDEFGELIDDVVESAEVVAERFRGRPRRGGRRWTEAARAARARSAERDEAASAAPAPTPPAPPAPAASARILGWQPLVLDEAQRCECGRALAPGEPAHVALTAAGPSPPYRCGDCIAGLGGAR